MNKQIKDMAPEELRIACAEKCGWKIEETCYLRYEITSPEGEKYTGWIDEVKSCFPDYERDRNALHELILAVPEAKHSKFVIALEKIVFDRDIPAIISVYVYDFLVADPLAIMRAFLEVMRIDDIKTD
jgi:hypothetical protein